MGARRPQAVPRAFHRRQSLARLGARLTLLGLVGLLAWVLVGRSAGRTADVSVYREAVVGASLELDPLAPRRAPLDPDVAPLLFRGLVSVDEHGEPVPDLAESWSVGGQGRSYRFKLRSDTTWDDGRPLTADDVVYSAQQAARLAAEAGEPSVWSSLTVRSDQPDVVEFVLPEPLGGFIDHAALPIVASHAPPSPTLPIGPTEPRPVTSGPFRFGEVRDGVVVLERNPRFSGPPPGLDRLEFQFLPSRAAAVEALLAGQVDGLADLSPVERDVAARSERLAIYQVAEYSKLGVIVLNAQRGPFRDRLVRQAASQAIDRELLIREALGGVGEPARGPLSPLSWAAAPDLPRQRHDQLAAVNLLEQAGVIPFGAAGPPPALGDGPAFTLLTNSSAPRLREALEVERQLEEVGFRVEVQALPLDELLDRHLRTGDFEAALLGRWLAETDPDQFALWHSTQGWGLGGNFSGLSRPELDHWLEIGRRQTERAERAEAYAHFQAIWAEEQPSVLLYHPHTIYAVSRELRGVRGGPLPDASWRLRQLPEWSRQPHG